MLKVLVTRPSIFAEPLCKKIADWGGVPIKFPTIEICPVTQTTALMTEVKKLNEFDLAIFASRPAAYYGLQAIQQVWPVIPDLKFMAMGPGTEQELRHVLPNLVYPSHPPYESEALLALPELQAIQQKKIILFRGNEGRMLLPDTLEQREASVTLCQTYQRKLPKQRRIEIPEVILMTSPLCLSNLKRLVGATLWRQFQRCVYITVGKRCYDLSATLGIKHRCMAESARDDHLLQALTYVRDRFT